VQFHGSTTLKQRHPVTEEPIFWGNTDNGPPRK